MYLLITSLLPVVGEIVVHFVLSSHGRVTVLGNGKTLNSKPNDLFLVVKVCVEAVTLLE